LIQNHEDQNSTRTGHVDGESLDRTHPKLEAPGDTAIKSSQVESQVDESSKKS
jgi:hypothetical protein